MQTWFGQPRGLTVLFLTEMWEKFSFFGMRALLVYYMVKHLHFEQGFASMVYGTYAAVVFLTPIVGAYISDRWLGKRRAIIIGSLTMAVGHFLMAFEPLLYVAMATIAVGNGLFLPNLPSQIGQLYERDDPRRQSAYSIYYLGVNLGAFFAPLVCGTLGEVYGWHYGFGAAGIGMCVGLAIYLAGSRYLPRNDSAEAPAASSPQASDDPFPWRMLLLVGLAVIVFRSAYEQSGNALALWIDQGVDRVAGSFTIPATWFQSLNPLFVFTLTPLIVAWWSRDKSLHGYRPKALRRMALGAFGVALSYALLCGLIAMAGGSLVHWGIVVAFFLLYTLAEIYILPIGLSLFATLSPSRFTATAIAAWFLAAFAGNFLGGYVGTWWSQMSPAAFFGAMAAIASASGVALAGLAFAQRK
ncbi:Dipeptide and tripeptide permease C [Usitatibacter rugosus]|uniref:Dipeptide and tripeptide permease C n=1 Tax=Usitatibacter rugosus TaxID=2732067 RepID=A0A6M4GVK6_9PROT|nr:peptide MFS transporter [Usitatibacter rugosus]QJR10363.1 Dipeptide and tripeptide permease C [Usitatibacter rugosus]